MACKHTLEYVRGLFLSRGATPLFVTYSNARQSLEFICSFSGCLNHNFISVHDISRHNPLLVCQKHARKITKFTFEEVKQCFLAVGATPLFTEYINPRQKLEFICSHFGCSNHHYIRWLNFWYQGRNPNLVCPQHSESNSHKLTHDEVSLAFSSRGAALVSRYIDVRSSLSFICAFPGCENIHTIRWRDFKQGSNPNLYCSMHLGRLSNELESKTLFLYDKGFSVISIARYFDVHPGTIINHLVRHDVYRSDSKYANRNIPTSRVRLPLRTFGKFIIIKACSIHRNLCPLCSEPLVIGLPSGDPLHVVGHHIIPWKEGGRTILNNCLPIHHKCHVEHFYALHGLYKPASYDILELSRMAELNRNKIKSDIADALKAF